MKRILEVLYIIAAVLTLLERYLLAGLFTGIFALCCILILGLINLILSAVSKRWNEMILYLLCTIAISASYLVLV